MFKLDLEKAEEPEIKMLTSVRAKKKQENSRKKPVYFWCSLTQLNPLTMWITKNWKILKEMAIPDHITWEICRQVKKQQSELDMEKWTGPKSGKEYIKAVYCHPAYLTYMQSTSCKIPG